MEKEKLSLGREKRKLEWKSEEEYLPKREKSPKWGKIPQVREMKGRGIYSPRDKNERERKSPMSEKNSLGDWTPFGHQHSKVSTKGSKWKQAAQQEGKLKLLAGTWTKMGHQDINVSTKGSKWKQAVLKEEKWKLASRNLNKNGTPRHQGAKFGRRGRDRCPLAWTNAWYLVNEISSPHRLSTTINRRD